MIPFTNLHFESNTTLQNIAETIAEQMDGYCTKYPDVDGYINPTGAQGAWTEQYLVHICQDDYLYKNGLYIGGPTSYFNQGGRIMWAFNGLPGLNRNSQQQILTYPYASSTNTYFDVNVCKLESSDGIAVEIRFPSQEDPNGVGGYRGPTMFIDKGYSIYDKNEKYGVYALDLESWQQTTTPEIFGVSKNSISVVSSPYSTMAPSSYMALTNLTFSNDHIISPNIYIREHDYYEKAAILPIISQQEANQAKNRELTNWHTFSLKDVGYFLCGGTPQGVAIDHETFSHCPALVLKIA